MSFGPVGSLEQGQFTLVGSLEEVEFSPSSSVHWESLDEVEFSPSGKP